MSQSSNGTGYPKADETSRQISTTSRREAIRAAALKSIHEKLEKIPTARLKTVIDLLDLHADEAVSDLDPDVSTKERQNLFEHLQKGTWCKLSPSKVCDGCGVFALRDIPAGTDPFAVCNEHRRGKQVFATFSDTKLAELGAVTQEYVEDFMAPHTRDEANWKPQRDGRGSIQRGILLTGMNTLDISWYVNHGDEGNLCFVDGEEGEFNGMAAKRFEQTYKQIELFTRQLIFQV